MVPCRDDSHVLMQDKGYLGKVESVNDLGSVYGKIINTHDVLTYQGLNVAEWTQAFRDSIDDYQAYRK